MDLDWVLATWSLSLFFYWYLVHLWSKLCLSFLILKVQRTPMSFKSSFGTFGGCWMFLTGVWYLYLDLDMVTGLWYNYDLNFGSLSWFRRCKEPPCLLSPHFWLRRTLDVPDWSLVFWSLYGNDQWSLIHTWSKFWLSILTLKVQRTSMSFKSWFGALVGTGSSWQGFGILILI